MAYTSVYPNSISILVVQTGCMTFEFDSTYRIDLNGIISPDEFQESMKKINQTLISMANFMIFFLLIVIFGVLLGSMICVMVLISISNTSAPFTMKVLVGFEIALIIVVFISMTILIFIVPICLKRTRKVIAKESLKYCSRLPTPCYWRLGPENSSDVLCISNNIFHYHIVIDIGPSVPPVHSNPIHYSKSDVSVPLVSFERQDVNDPPPYPDSDTRCCSQCSVPRRDSTAKFCSSCGQSFDEG